MERSLAILLFLVAAGVAIFAFPNGVSAVLVGVFFSVISISVIYRLPDSYTEEEKRTLVNIFVLALIFRVFLATVTYVFGLEKFFGGDQQTYDLASEALRRTWFGLDLARDEQWIIRVTDSPSGWGTYYLFAAIYSITGRNILALQVMNCSMGAATAVVAYALAKKIFFNQRVARYSAFLVAFFPSMIVWSSQAFKDPLVVFLLAVSMNALLSLQKKFSLNQSLILLFSLFGVYSLRFYLFYVMLAAVGASVLFGTQTSFESLVRRFIIVSILGFGMIYLGFLQSAQKQAEFFGDLEQLNYSRLDQARSAESGFGEEFDVSTSEGAIAVLPIGFVYLMFAPFPWQISNFRQAITLPEIFVWWAMIPMLVSGLIFTIRKRLQTTISMMFFTMILVIAYAIFQGNVGTAYRMRSQVQIFLFIFIAVGISLIVERREIKEAIEEKKNMKKFLQKQRAREKRIRRATRDQLRKGENR